MTGMIILIPAALFLGGLGLAAFIWSVQASQYEDLKGAAERILIDDDEDLEENENGADKGAESDQGR